MALDQKAMSALEKLEQCASEELARLKTEPGNYHDENYRLLCFVPGWIRFVRENHENNFAQSGVEGCLENLRRVVKIFSFKL